MKHAEQSAATIPATAAADGLCWPRRGFTELVSAGRTLGRDCHYLAVGADETARWVQGYWTQHGGCRKGCNPNAEHRLSRRRFMLPAV